jgi:hypothetical protein
MSLTKVSYSMITGAPVNVLDYGAVGDGVTNSSTAFQNALNSGASVLYVPAGTYLVQNVTISSSVRIYGDGPSSIIKSIPSVVGSNSYSTNIFTTSTGLSDVIFSNLTLNGSGSASVVNTDPDIEYALVLLLQVTRILFDSVTVTAYTANATSPSADVFSRHFQAITVRNLNAAEYVVFKNVLLTDNHYEMVDIYNGPTSNCAIQILDCSEINTAATPDAHTAFDISGGNVLIDGCYFYNTNIESTINLQVTSSSTITNNKFINQIGGASALGPSINYGQDGVYGQNNCIISNNYFNNVGSGCITHSGGTNIIITDNVMIDGGLNPINIVCNLNAANFAALYPAYTVPTLGPNYSLHIINNEIVGAQNTTGPTGRAVWFGYATPSGSNLWYDVIISENTISSDASPYNTQYCIYYNGVHDVKISKNYFNYEFTAIYSADYSIYCDVTDNIFAGEFLTDDDDIVFAGSTANSILNVCGNRFIVMPTQSGININVVSGTTFNQVKMIDNVGMKPRYEISLSSGYYQQYNYGQRLSSVPSTGIWNAYDTIPGSVASSQPMGWVCSANGSFATYTSTVSGVVGNYYLTATVGSQFLPGQYISVPGMGPSATTQFCVVCGVVGNIVYIDKVVSTAISGQSVTALNPTFHAMSNFA